MAVTDPFYNRNFYPYGKNMHVLQDEELGRDNIAPLIGAAVASPAIIKGAIGLAGKVFSEGSIGTKGYSKTANTQRVAQSIAIGRGALAGLSKKTLAEIATEMSPSGSKYSADGWMFAGKTPQEIAREQFAGTNKWLLKIGKSPISWEEFTGKQTSTQTVPPSTGIPSSVSKDFDILIPFVPVMKKGLQLKGITPSNQLPTLSTQFYNNVVVPGMGSNFAGQKTFGEIDLFDIPVNHADEAVDAIITGIITYINNLKQKKQQGEDLTGLESTVVTGAEKVETGIREGAKGQVAKSFGDKILFGGGWIWIVAGIVGIIATVLALRK